VARSGLSFFFSLFRVFLTFVLCPANESKTMRIQRTLPLALVALVTTDAFVPTTYNMATKRAVRSSRSELKISLDDSWSEAYRMVGDVYGEASQKIDWNKLTSPESWSGLDQVQESLASLWVFYASLPLWVEASAVVIPVVAAAAATLYTLSFPPDDFRNGHEPYQRGNYDPLQARIFYAQRPKLLLRRSLQLLRLSNKFIFNILVDAYIFKDEELQRGKRADQLLALIQKTGPTAIKVGQALSVRPDLIPIEYADALATLQDRVPPFSSAQAREILNEELGPARMSRIRGLKFEKGPIASASIGQVYQCFAGDTQVAIKIQRPNALAEIALDLHLVREFAPWYQKLTGSATDLQALANEWGRGFIAELDYHTEAANTKRFNVEMEKRNLNAVTAPVVVDQFSTDRILTTHWVDGTRLDQSDADDVPRLCSVALNAYLVMLLELQSLHCDPHPGTKKCAHAFFTCKIIVTELT
jgi:hypothetical protein